MPKLISQNGDIATIEDDSGNQHDVYMPMAPSVQGYLNDVTGAPADMNMSRAVPPTPQAPQTAQFENGYPVNLPAPKPQQFVTQFENGMPSGVIPDPDLPKPAQMPPKPEISAQAPAQGQAPEIKAMNEELLGIKGPQTPEQMLRSGFQGQMNIATKLGEAQAEGFKNKADAIKQGMDTLDTLNQQQADKQSAWNKREQDMFSTFQKSLDEIRNTKIDPWQNSSTGTKVMAAIAIGLGAVGQAMGGGPNQALSIINNQLDREIELQKQNLQNKKDYVNGLGKSYDMMRQLGMDDVAATNAMRANALERTKMLVEQYTASTESKQAKLQGQMLYNQLNVQQAEAIDKMHASEMDRFQKMYEPERIVPGLGYAGVGSKQDVSDFRKLYVDLNGADQNIKELQALGEQAGKSMPLSDARAKAQELQALLIGQLRTALVGPGAMSDSERALITNAIADPTAIFSLDKLNRVKLQTLSKVLSRKIQNAGQMVGLNVQPKQTKTIPGQGVFEEVEPGKWQRIQ